MLSARRAAKQLESLTLLQQEEEHRLREQQLQQKVEGLQESLREVTERSGKVRAQYERYTACFTDTRSSRASFCCSVKVTCLSGFARRHRVLRQGGDTP